MEVTFKQIAACQRFPGAILGLHFGHRYTVFVHPYLLYHQVVPLMLSIQDQFHGHAVRRPVQAGHGSYFHGYQIAHHGTVHKIGKQYPALVLLHSQNRLLGLKLYQIWLLRPFPGGISTAPYRTVYGFEPRISAFRLNTQAGRYILCLGGNGNRVFSINAYYRKTGIRTLP